MPLFLFKRRGRSVVCWSPLKGGDDLTLKGGDVGFSKVVFVDFLSFGTLPATNSSHLKIGLSAPKRNEKVFQPFIFRGGLLVSGRVILIAWGSATQGLRTCMYKEPPRT